MVAKIIAPSFRKTSVDLTTSWLQINAPIDSDYFGLRNTGTVDIHIKTSEDGGYDRLSPASQDGVTSAHDGGALPRFVRGLPVMWLRTESGIGSAMITWVA